MSSDLDRLRKHWFLATFKEGEDVDVIGCGDGKNGFETKEEAIKLEPQYKNLGYITKIVCVTEQANETY